MNERFKILFRIPQQRYPCYSLFTLFQTFCPGSYRLCHKHCPIPSDYVCDILPTRCLILGLFVCLNTPYWTCFACLSASYCFSLTLPPCLQTARGNHKDEEPGDQPNTCGKAETHTHIKPSIAVVLATKPQQIPTKLNTHSPHPVLHHPYKAWAISNLV